MSVDQGNGVLLVVLIMLFTCWTLWLSLRVKSFWLVILGIAAAFALILFIATHARFK